MHQKKPLDFVDFLIICRTGQPLPYAQKQTAASTNTSPQLMNDIPATRPMPGALEANATRVCFFVAGLGMSAWAPMVPFAKERLGLQDAALGTLLLCLGIGSILAMPLAGALTSRLDCKRVIVCATLLMCAMLPLLAQVSSPLVLGGVLFLFGAGLGALDCAMNIQAIIVERGHSRPMMSGFHGLFSVGGVVGAGGVSGLLNLGLPPAYTLLAVAVVIAMLLGLSAAHLLPYGGNSTGSAFARPKGVVILIGTFCFILFLTEGAVLDWSAVFLTEAHHVPTLQAGLGYAAFAAAMTVCRLVGDNFVHKIGPHRTVMAGTLIAATGLALAALVPSWQVALLGFALVGVGCANIVPILFSLSGKQTEMPENVAVPAIATLGYAGVLLGPAGIGFISHGSSLATALLLLSALLMGAAVSVRRLKSLG